MYKKITLWITTLFLLATCSNPISYKIESKFYLETAPSFPYEEFGKQIFIKGNTIYTHEVVYLFNANKIFWRTLNSTEMNTIRTVLGNLTLVDSIYKEPVSHAKTELFFNVHTNKLKKDVYVYGDTLPKELEPSIDLIENLANKGDFQLITSQIENIADLRLINDSNDNRQKAFELLIYLATYKGIIDSIRPLKSTPPLEKYRVLHGLIGPEETISTIDSVYVFKDEIALFYPNDKVQVVDYY